MNGFESKDPFVAEFETKVQDLNNNITRTSTTIPQIADELITGVIKYIDEKFDKLKMVNARRPKQHDNRKKDKRCITCKPRGKVKTHIIGQSVCGNFVFHHDILHRPMIIVTPKHHYKNITEIPADLLLSMYVSIDNFCKFWNIVDYQIHTNFGSWKVNEHFQVNIKVDPKIINRMRGDHFRFFKLGNNYKQSTVPV